MSKKRCPRCGEEKMAKEFYAKRGRGDGLSALCVVCHRAEGRECDQAVRQQALDFLGGKCAVCGFTDQRALQFDHVGGGGRQRIVGGEGRYRLWNGILDGSIRDIQVLCANDNHRKRITEGEHKGIRVYSRSTANLIGEKRCARCGQTKPLSEWSSNAARKDGLSVYCSLCTNKATKESRRRESEKLRSEMGGACARCGEKDAMVLCTDHVNGEGNQERKSLFSNTARFRAKIRENPDDYRLLCWNCNWIIKAEQNQTVGKREYTRKVPTERTIGPGKGIATKEGRAGFKSWWENATPEQIAARNAKISETKRRKS